jgi:hypothetical protein
MTDTGGRDADPNFPGTRAPHLEIIPDLEVRIQLSN